MVTIKLAKIKSMQKFIATNANCKLSSNKQRNILGGCCDDPPPCPDEKKPNC